MRDVIGGDAFMDWTIWYDAAFDLLMIGTLPHAMDDHRRESERRIGRGRVPRPFDGMYASSRAEDYAVALSRLGWCLRDAGALWAAYERGQSYGYVSGHQDACDSRAGC